MPSLFECAKDVEGLGEKFDLTPPSVVTKQTSSFKLAEEKPITKTIWGEPIEFRQVLAKVPRDTENPMTGLSTMRVAPKVSFTTNGQKIHVPEHYVNGMHVDGVNGDGNEITIFLNRHYFGLSPDDFDNNRVFRVVYRTKTIIGENVRKFSVLDLYKEEIQDPKLVLKFPKEDDHPAGSIRSLPIYPLTNRQVHFCAYAPPEKKKKKK